jgi:hypothetical protein
MKHIIPATAVKGARRAGKDAALRKAGPDRADPGRPVRLREGARPAAGRAIIKAPPERGYLDYIGVKHVLNP